MSIAKVEITGNINSRNTYQILELLKYAERKSGIKAVILAVNSGGGEVAFSEMLHDAIKKLRKKMPIYAVVEGIGASGAYWMISPATKIYAMRTAIIGSIGVIGIKPDVSGLMERLGLKIEVVKMGEYKDMINPFEKSSEIAKQKYMEILENSYSVLKMSIAENRNISQADLDEVTNGQIFTPKRSLELGLIDKIGSYDDALEDLSAKYKLRPNVRELMPHKTFFERIFTSMSVRAILAKLLGL